MAARNIRSRSRSTGPERWEMSQIGRGGRQGPNVQVSGRSSSQRNLTGGTADELHAWSIYRQNLNSEFTDSALGSSDKSPPPYGNFQLRETTVNSILHNPKCGARSALGSNMFTYLKYGLPRVFPPGRRDGSSGYDSSDDGSPPTAQERQRRAQSTPELRQNQHWSGTRGAPSDRVDRGGGQLQTRAFGDSVFRGKKGRSTSEANLVATGGRDIRSCVRDGACSPDALSELGAQSVYTHRAEQRRRRHASEAQSRAGSRLSHAPDTFGPTGFSRTNDVTLGNNCDPPILNDKLFPKDHTLDNKHPHLQLRGVSCERRESSGWRRLVADVSFEAHGGELVGILSSSEKEGSALLDVLADRGAGLGANQGRLRMRGDLILNGCLVSPARMASRVAYVQQDCSFSDNLSVRQTMLFSAFLQEPGHLARGFDIKQKIGALIDDLGLSQVHNRRISELTSSERRRLGVACQLCLDTDLVLLDQPTRDMDIFDTFFLVEYLRQWAGRGRIVMLTLQPPTYEVFTMLSRVVLLSTQRVIFSGKRREMLPYFSYIDYPCPAYKNPSDYYLDLVTLDDLSPEATLESSERVDELADTFKQRQQIMPEPGSPGLLPPKIRRANFCLQILALWIRALVYKFPSNLYSLCLTLFTAAFMSVVVGTVFYNQRGENRDQESIPDRLGFHYTMLSLAPWPLLLLAINGVWREKDTVTHDVADRLYTKFAYVFSKVFFSFPSTVLEGLLLVTPAYHLAGSQPNQPDSSLYVYIGYMLLYVTSLKLLAVAAASCFDSRPAAVGCLLALQTPLQLAAGWSIHPDQLSLWSSWLPWVSPAAWLYAQLAVLELFPVRSLRCDRNPIVPQDNTIIVQVDCGVLNGPQALRFSGLLWPVGAPLSATLVTAGWALLALLATLLAFVTLRQKRHRSRNYRTRLS